MAIPEVKHNAQLNTLVKLDPSSKFSRFFAMTTDRKKVVIAPSAKKSWMQGKICPENGDIPISFLLESFIAGDSEIQAKVRINSLVESEFRLTVSLLEVTGDEDEQWIPPGIERPKLKVSSIEQTFDGLI